MLWSLVLAVVGILGLYLAGKKNLWGWAIGLGAQILWIIYALTTAQYGFLLSAVAYGFVYAHNWYQWRRDIKELKQSQKESEESRDPELAAIVYLAVDIHMETEPTISTPDAYEPGYDYLVIRDVRAEGHNFYGGLRESVGSLVLQSLIDLRSTQMIS